jgi:threonine aldolase
VSISDNPGRDAGTGCQSMQRASMSEAVTYSEPKKTNQAINRIKKITDMTALLYLAKTRLHAEISNSLKAIRPPTFRITLWQCST